MVEIKWQIQSWHRKPRSWFVSQVTRHNGSTDRQRSPVKGPVKGPHNSRAFVLPVSTHRSSCNLPKCYKFKPHPGNDTVIQFLHEDVSHRMCFIENSMERTGPGKWGHFSDVDSIHVDLEWPRMRRCISFSNCEWEGSDFWGQTRKSMGDQAGDRRVKAGRRRKLMKRDTGNSLHSQLWRSRWPKWASHSSPPEFTDTQGWQSAHYLSVPFLAFPCLRSSGTESSLSLLVSECSRQGGLGWSTLERMVTCLTYRI